jgi:hypothetical protein
MLFHSKNSLVCGTGVCIVFSWSVICGPLNCLVFQIFFTVLGLQAAGLLVGAGPVEAGITPTIPLTGNMEAARVVHSDGHQTPHLAGVLKCCILLSLFPL